MKILSILARTFLYLEIFSQQTSGLNLVRYDCYFSYLECLTISDEKANWDTANATCVQQGGELIENVYIWVNDIVQAHNGGEYYWTGYRRVENTSVFQSTDGRTISDYSWKDNNRIAGVDCVGFGAKSGKFLSLECNANSTVVCEIDSEKCYARIQQYRDVCSSSVFSSNIPTESSLRDLTLNFNLTTSDNIHFYDYPQEIIITQLRANTQTQIPIHYYITIQIGTDTFQENTTLVIHLNYYAEHIYNASFILRSRLVTIYTNQNSTGNLDIFFGAYYTDYERHECVYLRSDGYWSAEGLTTQDNKSEGSVLCTTSIHGIITVGVYTIFETEYITILSEYRRSLFRIDCQNSNSYCVNISNEKATWYTANATCMQQGGRVLSYDSSENNWLTNQINAFVQANSRTENYWIGYKYNDNCKGIEGESGKLVSIECNSENYVICTIDSESCSNPRGKELQDLCENPIFSTGIPTESLFRDSSLNFSFTTGDTIQFYNSIQELIVTEAKANTVTQLPIGRNTIQIGTQETTTLFISILHLTSYQFGNFQGRGDIITVYSSNNSPVTVNILYNSFAGGFDRCVYLRSDGNWSTDGLDTYLCKLNGSIQCTTSVQNIGTIALKAYSYDWLFDRGLFSLKFDVLYSLVGILGFILFISLLLLLSSVVIFIVSGKKFFSHDINILHLNNTLSLFLAIISLPVLYPGFTMDKATIECFAISCLLQFLWTNIFLSSLSIAIAVFYTIWVASIKHKAMKLYKYLIPIGWGISLLWAVASSIYKTETANACDSFFRCFIKGFYKLDIFWPFLGLMIAILLINATLLILSLVKIWSVLRKQNSQEGELKRLRRVAIGGILLIPALGLPFISLMAVEFIDAPEFNNEVRLNDYVVIIAMILLINSPIGIVHFILITCQINETILRKYCCGCRRITPAQVAHSLHLNIARKSPKAKQETPDYIIPDSVPNTESTVYSNNSTEPIN